MTTDDRRLMIGVLAVLSTSLLAELAHPNHVAEERPMRRVIERYRRDLGEVLGRTPTNQECFEALEAQIVRLRESLHE